MKTDFWKYLSAYLEKCERLDTKSLKVSEMTLQECMDTLVLNKNIVDDDFWIEALELLPVECITVDMLNSLMKNKTIAALLAHKELKDEWLEKLCKVDDAALYILAKRYYCDSSYSEEELIEWVTSHQMNVWIVNVIENLLDIYTASSVSKKEKLIQVLKESGNVELKTLGELYDKAEYIRSCENPEEIQEIYNKHNSTSLILIEIAKNNNTSDVLLSQLSKVSGIKNAKMIRRICERRLIKNNSKC